MKKSATRSLVQAACVVAVLAVIAIPLSNLMVASSTAATNTDFVPATNAVDMDQSAESVSAVSALMAGATVGPPRGGSLRPRHPASAYVP